MQQQKLNQKNRKWVKHFLAITFFIIFALVFSYKQIVNDIFISSTDGLRFAFPLKYFTSNAFSGDFPLWNINAVVGQTAVGDVQNSLFYPFTYLAAVLSSVDFYNIFYLIHSIIAGVSAYLYCYNRYRKFSIALAAGILFMLAPIMGQEQKAHEKIIATVAWFPLIFLFIDKYLEKFQLRWIIFSGFFIAVQFSIGFVQVCLYSIIAYCIYMLIGIIEKKKGLWQFVKSVLYLGIISFGFMAVMLLPLYELMSFTSRNMASLTFFLSGSIRPLSILNTFIPTIISYGYIPTRLYIGIIPLFFALYSIIYHKKSPYVLTFIILAFLSYCFAAIGYIPIAKNIVFKIPLINSFRVPYRIIYVYCFSLIALAIYGLSKMKDKEDIKKVFKISIITTAVVAALSVLFSVFKVQFFVKNALQVHEIDFYLRILIYYVISAAAIGTVYFLAKKDRIKKNIQMIFVIIFLAVGIFDQGRYSQDYTRVYDSTAQYNKVQQLEILKTLKESPDMNESRILWATEDYIDIRTGMNYIHDVKVLNYYGAFDNPDFTKVTGDPEYMNRHGLEFMQYHNDFLSMLGTKYIVTDVELNSINKSETAEKVVFEKAFQNVQIKAKDKMDIKYELDIDGKNLYMISFDLAFKDVKDLDVFDVEISNDTGESLIEIESAFSLKKSENSHILLNYPNKDIMAEEGYSLHFYIKDGKNKEFNIENIKVTEISFSDSQKEIYQLIGESDGEYYIYENLNANKILYLADLVETVEGTDSIFPIKNKNLDEISYIENSAEMVAGSGKIYDIVVEDNWVLCKVESSAGAFLNHAQSYYPGWVCYIDGEKTTIYKVNGIIQGVYVPEGEHEVLFRYEPKSFKLGALISVATLLLSIIYLIFEKKNKRK